MKRVQSASSINMYKQCPRKCYYRYVLKLPEPPSIHTIRGNIVHSVLENFFALDPLLTYEKDLPKQVERMLDKYWVEKKEELKKLGMSIEELQEYYVDSRAMLQNWISKFIENLKATGLPFVQAFKKLTPSAEENLVSEELGIQGYIDALYILEDGNYKIVDYKTSRKDIITPEYSLQAGIYAVLVHRCKGKYPTAIEFDFLKGKTQPVLVTEYLVKSTLFEIEQIHAATMTEEISDFPKKPSALCKWKNARGEGQCPFYEICKPFDDK